MPDWDSLPKTTKYLEKEVVEARADIRRLQEEITALREKVVDLRHSLAYERCQHKMNKRKFDDTIKCGEAEKKSILSKQDELLSKIQTLEGTVECLNKRVQDMIAENVFWQSQCENLKSLNDRLERSKRSVENSARDIREELSNSRRQKKSLEEEKRSLLCNVNGLNQELQCLKDKLCCLGKENDSLKECLVNKSKEICKLEKENSKKYFIINQLEEKIARLNCELIRSNSEEKRAAQEVNSLKKELQSNLENNSCLQMENRKLTAALESAHTELKAKDCEYKKTVNEMIKLKDKLCRYAEQFKKVEEIIQAENKEKEELHYQVKTLEAKLSNLESCNQTIENENNWNANNLRVAQNKIDDLLSNIQTKDALVSDMECQIKELSDSLRCTKQDLSKQEQHNMKLQNEIESSRGFIDSLENQHKEYQSEIRAMECKVEQVTHEIDQSQFIIKELTGQLDAQKKTICSLEQAVSESRREAREESMQNLTVSQKVQELQDSVNKLQDKLLCVNNALSKCQNTCSEYKTKNNELKFQLVNDQYAKALSGEDKYKPANYRSSCFSGKDTSNMSTYVCSCSNKGRVYFKNNYNFCKDKTTENAISNIDCGSGLFTISVQENPNSMAVAPLTSASITVLSNARPRTPISDEIRNRKSSMNITGERGETKLGNESESRSNSGIPEWDDLDLPDTLTNHALFKKNTSRDQSDLKSILKEKNRYINDINNSKGRGVSSVQHGGSSKKTFLKESHNSSYDHKNSTDNSLSSKNYSIDNFNKPYSSIAEESPPYRLTKKCYKKVCFSDSDE